MPYPDSTYEQQWREARGRAPVEPAHCGHTPGPWYVDGPGEGIEVHDTFGRTASVWCERTERETWANARLIAAAPDLLAACEELLIYLGDWDDMDNDTCAAARKAIAKAEGRE